MFCEQGHVLLDPPSGDVLIGRTLDERYEVRAALGEGGFGMVYLGAQLRLDGRPCVIKVARPELAANVQFAARFEREKKALMSLRSRNTVQIIDYGRTDDAIDYIVMEFIEGDEMGRLLRRHGSMSTDRVIAIGRGICSSLIEAHAAGILHRDLKPGNVMLVDMGTSQLVKVIDFGIARLASGEGEFQTATGELPGTPAYSPYEQLLGQTRKVDERTDIYSLGAILYEALCGVVPYGDRVKGRDFDSKTHYFLALAQAKASEAPTLPSQLKNGPVPPTLERLIMSMLSKELDQRPASAQEVHDTLVNIERFLSAGDSGAMADDDTLMDSSSLVAAVKIDEERREAIASQPTLDSGTRGGDLDENLANPVGTEPPVLPEVAKPSGKPAWMLYGGGALGVVVLVAVAILALDSGATREESTRQTPPEVMREAPVATPAGAAIDLADVVNGAAKTVPLVTDVLPVDVPMSPLAVDVVVGQESGGHGTKDVVADLEPEMVPSPELVTSPTVFDVVSAALVDVVVEPMELPAVPVKEKERKEKRATRAAKPPTEAPLPETPPREKPSKEVVVESGEAGVKTAPSATVEPPATKAASPTEPTAKEALHKRLDFMDDEE